MSSSELFCDVFQRLAWVSKFRSRSETPEMCVFPTGRLATLLFRTS